MPRLFTPPLRRLTPRTSLGFAACDFARDVMGWSLLPWQEWLLQHMLETLPDGSLRFRTVVVLVARQNGKSTLSVVVALFFMYVLERQLVLGTAQDLDVAQEIWQSALAAIDEAPELAALKAKPDLTNGQKTINLTTGQRYKVKAATAGAGRGLSGDLILLDELRMHKTWGPWSAITKTTMARAEALILALTNAGDVTSVVLAHLRRMAHAALGDPDGIVQAHADLRRQHQLDDDVPADDPDEDGAADDALGLFEWSAAPDCSIYDRQGWADANPSLGYLITERAIMAAARTDPEWEFRTEVLCQWPNSALVGAFPTETWDAATNLAVGLTGTAPVLCVDVTPDRSWSTIGVAAECEDERLLVDIDRHARGTGWIPARVVELVARHNVTEPVVLTGKAAGALALDLDRAGVKWVVMSLADMVTGCADIFDAVAGTPATDDEPGIDPWLWHRGDPAINLAVSAAVPRRVGDDGWVWDRRGAGDISALVAVTGAMWGLRRAIDDPADYDVLASIY